MKHVPNLLSLANLFSGCIAIAFILSAPSFMTTMDNENYYPIVGMEQMYWGSVFIGIAALMDMLDGLAARALNSFSPLGKDLDSLADIVSFGVAPSMILFKLLWMAYMKEPGALDAPLIATTPAFLLACFAALRLAKFNHTADEQKEYFIGMPTPAIGLTVASFPMILFYNDQAWTGWLQNQWLLYVIIVLLCWLMHSPLRFFKWKPAGGIVNWWPQLVMAIIIIAGIFTLHYMIIPVAFVLYILLSLMHRPKSANA